MLAWVASRVRVGLWTPPGLVAKRGGSGHKIKEVRERRACVAGTKEAAEKLFRLRRATRTKHDPRLEEGTGQGERQEGCSFPGSDGDFLPLTRVYVASNESRPGRADAT